jgi:hypothetical protein
LTSFLLRFAAGDVPEEAMETGGDAVLRALRAHFLVCPGAQMRSPWPEQTIPPLDRLKERAGESYRARAPRKLIREFDARSL